MDLATEESELQQWLFADLESTKLYKNTDAVSLTDDLFVIDTLPSRTDDEDEKSANDASVPSMITTKRSVWKDDDEDNMQVNLIAQSRTKKLRKSIDEELLSGKEFEGRLREQFEAIHPKPSWLECQEETSDALFATTGNLIKSQKTLSPDKLLVTRVKDANQMGYSKVRLMVKVIFYSLLSLVFNFIRRHLFF
jgi:U3 small nucleolar RNA-associated protein 18